MPTKEAPLGARGQPGAVVRRLVVQGEAIAIAAAVARVGDLVYPEPPYRLLLPVPAASHGLGRTGAAGANATQIAAQAQECAGAPVSARVAHVPVASLRKRIAARWANLESGLPGAVTARAVPAVGQACARGTARVAVLVAPAAAALDRPLQSAPWVPRAPGRLGAAGEAAAQSVEQA